jgi:hypothetical protein
MHVRKGGGAVAGCLSPMSAAEPRLASGCMSCAARCWVGLLLAQPVSLRPGPPVTSLTWIGLQFSALLRAMSPYGPLRILTSPYVSQADIADVVSAGRAAPRAPAACAGPSGRRSVRTVLEGAPNPSADSIAAAAAWVGSHGRRPLRPRIRAERMTDGLSRAVAAPLLPPAAAGVALHAAKPAGLRVPLRRTSPAAALPLFPEGFPAGVRWGVAGTRKAAPDPAEAVVTEVSPDRASCAAAECPVTGARRAGEAASPGAGDGRRERAWSAGEAGKGCCWGGRPTGAVAAPVPASAPTPFARSFVVGVDTPRLPAGGCGCSRAAAAAAGMGRASPAALGETRQGRAREEAPRPRRERALARSRISEVTLEEGTKVAPGGSTAAAAAARPRGVPEAAAAAATLLVTGFASPRAGEAAGAAAARGSSQ